MWFVEEDEWLIINKYCKLEDIKFWGTNYTKDNKLRSKTMFILLKDLELDHIEAILVYFKKAGKLVNQDYLKYFKKRIKKGV